MNEEENKEEIINNETTEESDNKSNESSSNKERKMVVPGETIVQGDDYLPGDFTIKNKDEIVSQRYGLAEINDRIVKIIPISGVFEPRRSNNIIGRITDINFSGWSVEIGGPVSAFLPLSECPRFINKNNIEEFATIGDAINAKIWSVKRGSIDLTLKSRGLGVLEGGRLIKITSHKVPRVIGREGSMINLIKDETQTEITVGQNGFIWLNGSAEGERKAEEAIMLIETEASSEGLTDKVEDFLKNE
ncbi:RNA-binding protein [Candidatus Pacearchaeota archaeon]|nr:RNA-binding protein [Candidatus Pacearchaeota archaeon]